MLQLMANPREFTALPVREALFKFGGAYFSILENPAAVRLMRLVVSEAARRPHVAELFNEIGPNRVVRFLAGYFEAQMDAGVLRRSDPALAARCFMGPLVMFVITRVVFRNREALETDPSAMLESAVDVFLRGLEV